MITRFRAGLAVAVLISTGLTAVPQGAVAATSTVEIRLRAAIRNLPVAGEDRDGYDRDKFKHWIDADKDCRDTRDEVLAAESKVAVAGCDSREGEWVSYYDGRTWFRSSDVDIDHLVPLAEAWDSGASKWTARTRAAFANDLRFRPSLVAVTDNVNQSKSDQDFREWQPTRARCRYLREWVSVKTRWKLTADAAEKPFMRNFAETCRNRLLRVPIATVRFAEEPTEPPPPTATSVEIAGILYNPDGDESQNPNTEYLEIQNGTDESVELSSWSLSDDTVATYVFGDFTLAAGATVRVRSGAGTDTATDVYANWGSRWNNDGDTATLYDASGVVVDTCSYQSTTSGYADC